MAKDPGGPVFKSGFYAFKADEDYAAHRLGRCSDCGNPLNEEGRCSVDDDGLIVAETVRIGDPDTADTQTRLDDFIIGPQSDEKGERNE